MQNLSLLSVFMPSFCALIVAQNEIMLRIKKLDIFILKSF